MTSWRIAALSGAAILAACGQNDGGGQTADVEALDGPVTIEGFANPESVVYDPVGDRYFVGNVDTIGPNNDGFISEVSPEGEIVELRFIEGDDETPLLSALGTAVHDGKLYVADNPYVRVYDLETREQVAAHEVVGAGFLNDLDVDEDGTVFVSDMGGEAPETWAVHQIAPDGTVSVFAQGQEIGRPNGLELDNEGRIVLAVVDRPELVILSPEDGLVEQSFALPDGGYDGIVILDDGYVASNPFGPGIYRVAMDGSITEISTDIAQPASMGYDDTRNTLLIPMLQQNAITLYPLGD